MTSWFEHLLKRHVDLTRSDLVQRTPFDTQSLEETPDPPATVVNGHGRQSRFMRHVVGERFDLLRPGSERSRSPFQTPHKLEPSRGKWIEAALVGHFAFNFGESQGLSRPASQSKRLCNHQQTMGNPPQDDPSVTLVRQMCQESNTFVRQRTCAIACQYTGALEKLIEHSRTSGENRETDHSPPSLTPKLCGAENRRNAEIPMEERARPHNWLRHRNEGVRGRRRPGLARTVRRQAAYGLASVGEEENGPLAVR